jgi:hypothetical protein
MQFKQTKLKKHDMYCILRAVSTGSIRAQETNKDQIEELPAPSRIPNTNDSPAVVLSTTETTLDVKVVGQPRVKQLYLGCIGDNMQHISYNYIIVN